MFKFLKSLFRPSEFDFLKTAVIDQLDEKEISSFKDFEDFFDFIDQCNAYEENWEEEKEGMKPLYKKVFEELRAK